MTIIGIDANTTGSDDILFRALMLTDRNNEAFLQQPVEHLPKRAFQICAIQGECALWLNGEKENGFIGSEDATTCIIVLIKCHDCFFVGHLDSRREDYLELVKKNVALLVEKHPSKPLQLYLVGGYDEGSKMQGYYLSCWLVRALHVFFSQYLFHLELCALFSSNTHPQTAFPRSRQLVMELKVLIENGYYIYFLFNNGFQVDGVARPYLFSNLGPELSRR